METSHKTQLLYAVGLGLILSDAIPTVADSLYFAAEQRNKKKLENKEITPRQYWLRDAAGYYGYNVLYWSSILGITVAFGKSFEQKRNIFLSLLAGGLVIAVIHKNIQKDEAGV